MATRVAPHGKERELTRAQDRTTPPRPIRATPRRTHESEAVRPIGQAAVPHSSAGARWSVNMITLAHSLGSARTVGAIINIERPEAS